jgi:hypothetical protein
MFINDGVGNSNKYKLTIEVTLLEIIYYISAYDSD